MSKTQRKSVPRRRLDVILTTTLFMGINMLKKGGPNPLKGVQIYWGSISAVSQV